MSRALTTTSMSFSETACERDDEESQPHASPSRHAIWKPFPLEVFPAAIRRYVTDVSESKCVDPAMVVSPLLAVASAAIGNSAQVEAKPDWREPLMVWTVVLAESGDGKSPAAAEVLRLLEKHQAAYLRQYNYDLAAFQKEQAAAAPSAKGHPKQARQAVGAAQAKAPVCKRLIFGDCTMERICGLMDENPRGLLCHRDELAGLFKSMDAYRNGKGGDLEHWLSMHSASPIYVDRKNQLGPLVVTRPFVALTGGCQPPVMTGILAKGGFTESGFWARMLPVLPPRMPQKWSERSLSSSVAKAAEQVVDNLLALALEFEQGPDQERMPNILRFTAPAKAYFAQWHDRFGETQVELGGSLAASYAKLKGQAIRLSGIIQLLRWACGENASRAEVDLASVQAACQMADWFANEAERIFAVLGTDPRAKALWTLEDLVRRHGGRGSVREVCQWANRYRGKSHEAERDLQELVRRGAGSWEVPEPGSRGGRPPRAFVLNHSTAGNETPRIAEKTNVTERLSKERKLRLGREVGDVEFYESE